VIEPTEEGLAVREAAPGVRMENIMTATKASLIVPAPVPGMSMEACSAYSLPAADLIIEGGAKWKR
jgi:hypothetical protein